MNLSTSDIQSFYTVTAIFRCYLATGRKMLRNVVNSQCSSHTQVIKPN